MHALAEAHPDLGADSNLWLRLALTQDKPEGWTFEKAKQEEAEHDRALANHIRGDILATRADIEDLQVGPIVASCRPPPVRWSTIHGVDI